MDECMPMVVCILILVGIVFGAAYWDNKNYQESARQCDEKGGVLVSIHGSRVCFAKGVVLK